MPFPILFAMNLKLLMNFSRVKVMIIIVRAVASIGRVGCIFAFATQNSQEYPINEKALYLHFGKFAAHYSDITHPTGS
jgi:hypothetical protein